MVTDFFGASLEGVNVRFKRIYDYLTTINTSSNQTENYSSVSDESLKGVALIKAIIKNAGIDSDFLTSVADMQVTTLPNLNISYQVAGNSRNLPCPSVTPMEISGDCLWMATVILASSAQNPTPCSL